MEYIQNIYIYILCEVYISINNRRELSIYRDCISKNNVNNLFAFHYLIIRDTMTIHHDMLSPILYVINI